MFGSKVTSIVIREDLRALAPDLRRMLRIQFKEFVHHLEDNEVQTTQTDSKVIYLEPYVSNFNPSQQLQFGS